MSQNSTNMLNSDSPALDPTTQDHLGYAPFAKMLATSLCRMVPQDGIVTAIYGPWGSGKTTLLNFINYYLMLEPEEQRPVVVRFNPWWFSGDDQLIRHFFSHVMAELSTDAEKFDDKARSALAAFADAISQLPLTKFLGSLGAIGLPHFDIEAFFKLAAGLLKESDKDVSALKDEATKALGKQSRKILIIIDDIDRLTGSEMRQLFRVVKAVADFPNVIYLLAFDRGVAAEVLGGEQTTRGISYLEKIIQVPFELPLASSESIRGMINGRLNTIAGDLDEGLFDNERWSGIYSEGLSRLLISPRAVIRLTNTLSVTYPSVAGEVNFADFVSIEALRVFQSDVYDVIRRNSDKFCGQPNTDDRGKEVLKTFHNAWLDQVPEDRRLAVQSIVMRLFPKLISIWPNRIVAFEDPSKWRRAGRICYAGLFSLYFSLNLPNGALTRPDVISALSVMRSTDEFANLIRSLNNVAGDNSAARELLSRLADFMDDGIEPAHARSAIRSLANVGDELIRNEKPDKLSFLDFGVIWQLARFAQQLLLKLSVSERYEILQEVCKRGNALLTISWWLGVEDQAHGRFDHTSSDGRIQPLTDIEMLVALESIVGNRIREKALDGSLYDHVRMDYLLFRWNEWGHEGEVTRWLTDQIEDDDKLRFLLTTFLRKPPKRGSIQEYRLDPEWFNPLLDKGVILNRVEHLSRDPATSGIDKIAVEQFLLETEMRKSGKDPNRTLS